MRKHFLLLFLMALLPLAGWAEDLTQGMFTVESPYYGNLPVITSTVPVTGYDLVGYYSDAAATTAETEDAIKAANAGVPFYVKFTGKNVAIDDICGWAQAAVPQL